MEFRHTSVMPEETLAALAVKPAGTYVDCTLGGAGHARRIADRLSPAGRLIGLDQDEAAIRAAKERLAGVSCRVDVVRSNFRALDSVLQSLGVTSVDGVLFDLGVSSHQIDTAERGFSYMQDAPLDMRMDTSRLL
ncbi:16S rRNA (cytosine(1402)-N(4))-methyltransferase, partial [uncultured Selenomonas sp.]